MIDLNSKIPFELIRTLNEFNVEFSGSKKDFVIDANSRVLNLSNSKFEQIVISYKKKNSDFFFAIFFTVSRDLINWKYYPYNNTSSRPTSTKENDSNDASVYKRLLSALKSWLQLVTNLIEIENPLRFFEIDDFIRFYSDEILTDFPISDEEKKFPLSSKKQQKAIDLINIQEKFIEKEIEKIEDKTSEKYQDLDLSRKLLERIKEEIPRKTAAEIKRNWSISLGGIKKWCSEKFIQFLIVDKQSNFDLSRTVGSFMGGVFGIPKIEQ